MAKKYWISLGVKVGILTRFGTISSSKLCSMNYASVELIVRVFYFKLISCETKVTLFKKLSISEG